MIFKILLDSLDERSSSFLQEAVSNPKILQHNDFALLAFFGVTGEQISAVREALFIHSLESQLSNDCPYCTLVDADVGNQTTQSYWLSFRCGVNVQELALQEFSNGAISSSDELHLIRMIAALPSRYTLLIRSR